MDNNRKNYCFIHNALMGNYEEISDLILNNFIEYGLYDRLEKMYVCNLGKGDYRYKGFFEYKDNYDKIEYVNVGTDIRLYEYPTLQVLYDFSKDNINTNIFYLNNYGVSHAHDQYFNMAKSWREILIHFNIKNHNKCISDLNYFDISGADWQLVPLKHFCGNWWWARSEYINTLMNIEDSKHIDGAPTPRHGAEMWIGTNPSVNSNGNFFHGYDWTNKPARTDWINDVKK